MKTSAIAPVALAVLVAAGGCGDSDRALSRQDFVRKANAICGEANERVRALGVSPKHVVPSGPPWRLGVSPPPAQGGIRMKVHGNARTCLHSRLLMVRRVREEEWTLAQAAEAAGVSVRTVSKWLRCYDREGEEGLLDRSSAPRTVANRTPEDRIRVIAALRRLHMTGAEIAELLTMPLSTVSVILTRIELGRLSRLEPREPANRYEKSRAGELVHVDVKKLGRIARPGHRVTGRVSGGGQHRRAFELGWEFVHVAIDDATRSPTPRCSRTRRAERRPPSCGARSPSSRASASASSG